MTNTTKKLWLLALLGLLASCQPRDGRPETKQRELMHTSFEELLGWMTEVPPSLTTEKAHSGKYAVRVDPSKAYSLSYRTTLGAICPTHRPRRFTLNAWVWVPSAKDDAVIVFALSNPDNLDQPIYRKSMFLTDSGPFQQWKLVSRDFDLPENINSQSILTIYLWSSNSTEPVYADDLQLTELW